MINDKHTNSVNIFVNAVVVHARQVIVDNVHDVADIKTTRGDRSSNEDGAFTSSEGTPVESKHSSEAAGVWQRTMHLHVLVECDRRG